MPTCSASFFKKDSRQAGMTILKSYVNLLNAFVLLEQFEQFIGGGTMLKAKDFMTKDVITISSAATVEELARLLIEHKISGAPVVNNKKELIGIVTENDLISQNKRLHIPTIIRLFDAFIVLGSGKLEEEIKQMAAATVEEICIKKVVSITEDTPLQEVATIMSEQKIHLLPVLRNNVVVGIVGKADIVNAMSREIS